MSLLDRVFARWDALVADRGLEKIKTIGDAYMAAGGIPLPRAGHAEAIADLALAMGPELARCSGRAYERLRHRFELRPRGTIGVKGKGPMTTYLLLGPRS